MNQLTLYELMGNFGLFVFTLVQLLPEQFSMIWVSTSCNYPTLLLD